MENAKIINTQSQTTISIIETDDTNNAINLLNDLVSTNRGIIKVYQTAVSRLENEINANILGDYIEQHETFVAELSNVIVSLSGTPTTDTDGGNLVKRAWVTLKAAVTEGDGPILNEVSEDAEAVLNAYGEAMGAGLPEEAQDIIRQHTSKSRLAYEKLSGLSAAYNS